MKRKLVTALCGTLALAMAVPAFAKDHSINGYFRARFMTFDLDNSKSEDSPKMGVDQRFRAKWTMGLNEYVSVVYYGEVDFQYGDVSYGMGKKFVDTKGDTYVVRVGNRNDGGGIGGDTVNLETKNLYLDVKIPDTPVAVRVGLQGYADHWSYSLWAADMAGVKVSFKTDMVSGNVAWFKWSEGSPSIDNKENDQNLYALQTAFSPVGGLSVGADFYWLDVGNEDTGASSADIMWAGLNAKYKVGPAALSGWFAYNFGSAGDVDYSAFAGSLSAAFAPAPGFKAKVLALYFSGDDDNTDTDVNSWYIPKPGEDFFFGPEGFMLMLADLYLNTEGGAGIITGYGQQAVVGGWGLWGVGVTGQFSPAAVKGLYVKGGVGYFATTTDEIKNSTGKDERDGTGLGTEIFVRVGKKIAELVDVSLNASYAILGDFYADQATDDKGKTDDPNNPYLAYLMVNVPF